MARKTRNRTGPAGRGKTHNATATEKGTSFNDANAGISVRVILPVHPSDFKPAQAGRAIIDGVLLVVFLFLRPPRRLHSGLFLTEAVVQQTEPIRAVKSAGQGWASWVDRDGGREKRQ